MLSLQIKPIPSGETAGSYYFAKDNYYFSNELSTLWQGKAAARLNLQGRVEQETLKTMLNGTLPNGDVITKNTATGETKHRGGYDLTFSAPKSLSYLALVGGHQEFVELHNQAVSKVLSFIEEHAAEARKQTPAGMTYEKTKNLCFATINHDTTREKDPHLHTHGLLMNVTERSDGKWRALASDFYQKHGTMEWISQNKIFLGLMYRSEIALGLKSKGLDIEFTGDKHGLFEIKHFDPTLLGQLSKRRTQIEDKAATMISHSPRAYDVATLATRKQKEINNPKELHEAWVAESQLCGIRPQTYLDVLKEKTLAEQTQPIVALKEGAEDIIKDAVLHLSEKKLHFEYNELLEAGLYLSLGQYRLQDLLPAIEKAMKSENIIALDDEQQRFTTKALIEEERHLIHTISRMKPQKKSLQLDDNKISNTHSSIQKVAIEALQHRSSVIRIRDEHPTSVAFLKAFIPTAEEFKHVEVITPSKPLANTINVSQDKPKTVWQWLKSINKPELAQSIEQFNTQHEHDKGLPFFKMKKERDVLIVDDVQRLSSKKLQVFIDIAAKREAKVILIERSLGLNGFKSDISNLLDKSNIKTFDVQHKVKSDAVISIAAHKKTDERLAMTAQEYVSRNKDMRQHTLVLTASNKESEVINHHVRDILKSEGGLSSEEKTIKTLQPVFLTPSEKKLVENYKNGWIIAKQDRLDSKCWTILSVDTQKQQLNVRDATGYRKAFSMRHLQENIKIYETKELTISKGEWLYTTANVSGIKAGRVVEVKSFSSEAIRVKDGNKSYYLEMNQNGFMPLAYAYAKSIYRHDKSTQSHLILSMPAYALRKNVLTTALSLTDKSLHIVTDDAERVKQSAKSLQSKTTAIDLTIDAANLNQIDKDTWSQSLNSAMSHLIKERPKLTQSERALYSATIHLSEQEAVFSRFDVLGMALQKSMGRVSLDSLMLDMNALIKKGELIETKSELLTTPAAIALEKEILTTVRGGVNKFVAFLSKETAHEEFNRLSLTDGQQKACQLITTTRDQFVMIQGYAGTGKTTMMKSVIDTLKNSALDPVHIMAVAPTHQAVHEIRNLGINAQTLKRFLMDQTQMPTLNKRTLVLLDESSMVGNKDFEMFTCLIQTQDARCVIMGDIAQHQAIESGKPSALLLKEEAIQVAYMNDVVRQKNDDYKAAVLDLIKGDTSKALTMLANLPRHEIKRNHAAPWLESLKHSLVEVSPEDSIKEKSKLESIDQIKHQSLIHAAVEDYLSRVPTVRDNTIVVIHENKAREEANQLIRQGLIEQGELGQSSVSFERFISTRFSQEELKQVETYRQCLAEKSEFYLKKDKAYFKLLHVDEATRSIDVLSESKERFSWLPDKFSSDAFVELFVKKTSSLAVGEKIHFKKSDPTADRYANQALQVIKLDNNQLTAMDKLGALCQLSKGVLADLHWDYSYTSTSYAIQGASAQFVIGVEDTKNPQVSHFRSFYITATRGVSHAMIYTDSGTRLQKRLQHEKDKYSALEEMGEIRVEQNRVSKKTSAQESPKLLSREKRLDATAISDQLVLNAEYVIETILGEPNAKLSSKDEYRYGKKGSLSVSMHGEHRGTWFDFETSEKGNLLHLIQRNFQLDFKGSLAFSANLMGQDFTLPEVTRPKVERIKENKKDDSTKAYAEKLSKESLDIRGTLAEKYLKEHRSILDTNSRDIRFHPRVYSREEGDNQYLPALIAIARDKDNQVQSVQTIYLDNSTAKKSERAVTKRTFSSISGAAVIINEGKHADSVTYIAEGVETALSIRDAVKHERVLAVLGKQNFTSISPELLTKEVVLCLDNDGKDLSQDKTIHKAIQRLNELGKTVAVAYPLQPGDFNDIARSKGVEGVLKELNYSACMTQDRFEQSLSNKVESSKQVQNLGSRQDRVLEYVEREL